jgi:hypothetical protein
VALSDANNVRQLAKLPKVNDCPFRSKDLLRDKDTKNSKKHNFAD